MEILLLQYLILSRLKMRNYKRKTNRGKTPQCVIERAVECALNGDLGVRAAARDHNINNTTLIGYMHT